jgi:hypothetical protein
VSRKDSGANAEELAMMEDLDLEDVMNPWKAARKLADQQLGPFLTQLGELKSVLCDIIKWNGTYVMDWNVMYVMLCYVMLCNVM